MRKLTTLLAVILMSFATIGCDVDVKDTGELPDVDVEGGRAPDVDVTTPDVDVKTRTTTVQVPDVDVDVPEENEQ